MNARPTATLAAAFALMATLPGCENLFGARTAATTAGATAPVSDEGIARACTASPVDLSASQSAAATIAMSNEGGWCAVRVAEKDGQPFAAGLVRIRPDHGRLLVEKAGAQTRIEYYPTPGYAGPDTFTVALRSRTTGAPDATVKVNVTVSRAG